MCAPLFIVIDVYLVRKMLTKIVIALCERSVFPLLRLCDMLLLLPRKLLWSGCFLVCLGQSESVQTLFLCVWIGWPFFSCFHCHKAFFKALWLPCDRGAVDKRAY